MQLSDFNWGLFTVLVAAIVVTRVLMRGLFPWRLISVTTTGSAGIVMFLALGVLSYSDSLGVPPTQFAFLVWLSYLSFMVGASLVTKVWGATPLVEDLPRPSDKMTRAALIFCALFVATEAALFLASSGVSRVSDVLFGGWAHQDAVARAGDIVRSIDGFSVLDIVRQVSSYAFVGCWVVAFSRAPRRSMVLYILHCVSQLNEYNSRSTLLGMVILPYLAYLVVYRPSRRWVSVQLSALVMCALVFFSWNSAVRLGSSYWLSLDVLVSDTLRDAGVSIVPASLILHENLRGEPGSFLITMVTFPVPRGIWPEKPAITFNYDVTQWYTGLIVGYGTSVVTSTMLGEAWYFFGVAGTVVLMMLFGATAQLLERLLTRKYVTLGIYLGLCYSTFIMVRSTYLTYYQAGVIAALSALLLVGMQKALSGARQDSLGPIPVQGCETQTDEPFKADGVKTISETSGRFG